MKTSVFFLRASFILTASIWCPTCRSLDEADTARSTTSDGGADGIDDSESKVDNTGVVYAFSPYECKSAAPSSCDAVACGFAEIREEITQRCDDFGPTDCEAVQGCFSVFDSCLQNACPPGTTAQDTDFSDTCSTELSACLVYSVQLDTSTTEYRESDLILDDSSFQRNDNGFNGFWYTFSDSDDGGGASAFTHSQYRNDIPVINEDEACVIGVASQIKNGQDAVYWGAGFGWDLCEQAPIGECDYLTISPDQFMGIVFDIEGYWGRELRVLFHEDDSDESPYIVVPSMATHVVALVDQADVWYNPGHPVDVENIDAIQFQIATNSDAPTPFDFCIRGLSALLRQPDL